MKIIKNLLRFWVGFILTAGLMVASEFAISSQDETLWETASGYYKLVADSDFERSSSFVLGNPRVPGRIFYWGPDWPAYGALDVRPVSGFAIGPDRHILTVRYLRDERIGYLMDLWLLVDGEWKTIPLNLIQEQNVYFEVEDASHLRRLFVTEKEMRSQKIEASLRLEFNDSERRGEIERAKIRMLERMANERAGAEEF